mgnify:CR=1 FL=1
MSDATYRKERIERLLNELEYEITRGMMDNEIGERVSFNFVVPISRTYEDGVVQCRFETRPVKGYFSVQPERKLRLVKGGDT